MDRMSLQFQRWRVENGRKVRVFRIQLAIIAKGCVCLARGGTNNDCIIAREVTGSIYTCGLNSIHNIELYGTANSELIRLRAFGISK